MSDENDKSQRRATERLKHARAELDEIRKSISEAPSPCLTAVLARLTDIREQISAVVDQFETLPDSDTSPPPEFDNTDSPYWHALTAAVQSYRQFVQRRK